MSELVYSDGGQFEVKIHLRRKSYESLNYLSSSGKSTSSPGTKEPPFTTVCSPLSDDEPTHNPFNEWSALSLGGDWM